MPTTIYDSSLLTQRKRDKAISGSFISRIQPWSTAQTVNNQPNTGSAPYLGITDQSIINTVKNGQMTYYRKNDGGCTNVSEGCPCESGANTIVIAPGSVSQITVVYGSVIVQWGEPEGTPPFLYTLLAQSQTSSSNNITIKGISANSYTFSISSSPQLVAGDSYVFKVFAYNSAGKGPEGTSLTPFYAPYSPPIVNVTNDPNVMGRININIDNYTDFTPTEYRQYSYVNGSDYPNVSTWFPYTQSIQLYAIPPAVSLQYKYQLRNGNQYSSFSAISSPIRANGALIALTDGPSVGQTNKSYSVTYSYDPMIFGLFPSSGTLNATTGGNSITPIVGTINNNQITFVLAPPAPAITTPRLYTNCNITFTDGNNTLNNISAPDFYTEAVETTALGTISTTILGSEVTFSWPTPYPNDANGGFTNRTGGNMVAINVNPGGGAVVFSTTITTANSIKFTGLPAGNYQNVRVSLTGTLNGKYIESAGGAPGDVTIV